MNELTRATIDGTFLPHKNDVNFRCGISRFNNNEVKLIIGGTSSDLLEFPFAVLLVIVIATLAKNKLTMFVPIV